MIGETLGHFQITEKLGAGGMGEVYKAIDQHLGREVAIKVLRHDVVWDSDRLSRFKREAKALAKLSHPNIVTVYSVEHTGDHRFFTMEFVTGKTVAQLIPSSGMTVTTILAISIPLADALASAHRQGVVHRDLKPANVMVSDEGRVKVLDFGLARWEPPDAGTTARTVTEALTHGGQVIGTCYYMSPEQAAGKSVDHRSDIFSLGAMLFHMATGHRPFEGARWMDVIMAVLNMRPPLINTLNPSMPIDLARLVSRCLEQEPERRIQTARDVCNELESIKQALDRDAQFPSRAPAQVAASDRSRRIAVLPFANMSADPEQQYFCDGMAEDVINALAHVEGLQVAARTSAFAFKGQNRDIREIGQLLDVGAVLEGSVRRAGNRLRVVAQLIRVCDGMHLWSERFDRQLDDVFAIQDEISLAIVDRLKVQLLEAEEARVIKRHTVDMEAHTLYLKGRFFWNRRTEGDVARAMMCYEQAMKQDPRFPLPYVGLADALITLGMFNLQRPRDVFPKAKTAAERALAIDDALAEAHASMGYIATVYDWDWVSAERHLMRALTRGPRCAVAHHWYAIYLNIRGRFAESIREALRCVELEPLSVISYTLAGQMYLGAGRYPEAVEQLRKALELDVQSPIANVWLATVYLMMKRPDDAMEVSANLAQAFSASSMTAYIQTYVFIQMGRFEEARRVLAEAEELEKSRYLGQMSLALAHAGLGEMDAAVERLERAFEEREPQLVFLKHGRLEGTEVLLAHPKVQTLMKNAGLPT